MSTLKDVKAYGTQSHLKYNLKYTVSQKSSQNCFHQNFVKFPPTLMVVR